MSDKRCLYCYQPLEGTGDFHQKCSRSFFGQPEPPSLDLDKKHLLELAEQTVARSVTMTGVQPKLSVTIEPASGDAKRSRVTIVGLWGQYILKPPNPEFAGMPENEDLTMRLNELVGIPTADHSLIRLSSGELAYITHRFDRHKGNKLAVEDMCQLTETLTVDKYRGSMEKIGRIITDFSSRPGYDKLIFFETTLLAWMTGNADMHLKNFSLLTGLDNEITLAPAYDCISSKLVLPEDKDELALTLNGKKRKLSRRDFDEFADVLKIPPAALNNSYTRVSRALPAMIEQVRISFLPDEMKAQYIGLLTANTARFGW